jgi:hypothetical protein
MFSVLNQTANESKYNNSYLAMLQKLVNLCLDKRWKKILKKNFKYFFKYFFNLLKKSVGAEAFLHLEQLIGKFQIITNQQGIKAMRSGPMEIVVNSKAKSPRSKTSKVKDSKHTKQLKQALVEAEEEIKRLNEEKKQKDHIFTEILQNKNSTKLAKDSEKFGFTKAYGFNPPLPTAVEDLQRIKMLELQIEDLTNKLNNAQ